MLGTIPILHLAEVDSTNAEAMRRARAGEPAPLWITAERQTAGRGRSGRTWVSEPGNFHGSLMIRPTCPPSALAQLSLVAGVALIDALLGLTRAPMLRLKWPNDLMIGAAKAGGILVESSSAGVGDGMVAVIGVGVNLATAPAALPTATSLADHGVSAAPNRLLPYLDAAMQSWLTVWNNGADFDSIRRAWLARAGQVGEPMTVHAGDDVVTGVFAGLDLDGALLMDVTDERRRRFTFGDVALHAPNNPARTP